MSAGSPVVCVSCQATWIIKSIGKLVMECTFKGFFRCDPSPDNSRVVTQKSHRGSKLCYRSGVETLLHPAWRTSDGDRLYTASDL